MTLQDDLRDAAIRTEVPINELLRRLLVVAYQLDAAELKTWLTWEMNGYDEEAALPRYRAAIEVHAVGEFELRLGDTPIRRDIYPVAKSYFEGKDVDFLFRREFREPVAHYDDYLRGHPNETEMLKPWPGSLVAASELIGYRINRGQKMLTVSQVIPRAALLRVTEGVRNAALTFILQLEKVNESSDGATFKAPPDTVRTMVQNNFYGPGYTVQVAGHDATMNIYQQVTPGDRASLLNALMEAGVGEQERAELELILGEETPANNSVIHERVLAWASTLGTLAQAALAAWSAFHDP